MEIILNGTEPNALGTVQPPHLRAGDWVGQVLWVVEFGERKKGNTW